MPRRPGRAWPRRSNWSRRIDTITRNFSGLVGVAVTSVDDGWIASNAHGARKLPQQSVSKLWVTMTVLDAVDRGSAGSTIR
jgi:beta-lactamase class A